MGGFLKRGKVDGFRGRKYSLSQMGKIFGLKVMRFSGMITILVIGDYLGGRGTRVEK